MPNGCRGKGSHTHNDKLSFILRVNGEELFGDSGTGVYTRYGSMSAFQPAEPALPADPARFFTGVLADQHYQKGVQFEQQGEWERALAAYRKASSLDPHRVLFLLARGRICQAHGLPPEAEECYQVALRLRPETSIKKRPLCGSCG